MTVGAIKRATGASPSGAGVVSTGADGAPHAAQQRGPQKRAKRPQSSALPGDTDKCHPVAGTLVGLVPEHVTPGAPRTSPKPHELRKSKASTAEAVSAPSSQGRRHAAMPPSCRRLQAIRAAPCRRRRQAAAAADEMTPVGLQALRAGSTAAHTIANTALARMPAAMLAGALAFVVVVVSSAVVVVALSSASVVVALSSASVVVELSLGSVLLSSTNSRNAADASPPLLFKSSYK